MRVKSVELIVLASASVVVLADGIALAGLDRMRAGEAGAYEILLGLLLGGLTVLYARSGAVSTWPTSPGLRHVAIAFAILVLYALALPHLGYLISTFVAVVTYMCGLSGYRWQFAGAFALAFAVGTAWLWAELVIIVPRGILPWPQI